MALANNPNDAVSSYRWGFAYLAMTPPQSLDGFWALARAINLKVPDARQGEGLSAIETPGLRTARLRHPSGCAAERIAATGCQLTRTARDATQFRARMIYKDSPGEQHYHRDHRPGAGGDKAKMTWLAICGAEFPEVVGKIIDEQNGRHFG